MPKSKRVKVVALTKTLKRSTKEKKSNLIEKVQQCLQEYEDVYVFDYSNCRSKHLKDARIAFRDESEFFLTKNKILKVGINQVADDFKKSSPIADEEASAKGLIENASGVHLITPSVITMVASPPIRLPVG